MFQDCFFLVSSATAIINTATMRPRRVPRLRSASAIQAVLLFCCCCFFSQNGVLLLPGVSGYTTGAGACPAGRAAVGDPHYSGTTKTGTLEEANIRFNLNDNRLTPSRPFFAWSKEPVAIKIIAPLSGQGIRGFLIRLGHSSSEVNEAFDLTNSVQVASNDDMSSRNVQVSDLCMEANAGGVTHTDNTPKYVMQATLQIDHVVSDLQLDVTVVVANRDGMSEFYYSNYTVHALQPTQPPGTDAPQGTEYIFIGEPPSSSATATGFSNIFVTMVVAMTMAMAIFFHLA